MPQLPDIKTEPEKFEEAPLFVPLYDENNPIKRIKSEYDELSEVAKKFVANANTSGSNYTSVDYANSASKKLKFSYHAEKQVIKIPELAIHERETLAKNRKLREKPIQNQHQPNRATGQNHNHNHNHHHDHDQNQHLDQNPLEEPRLPKKFWNQRYNISKPKKFWIQILKEANNNQLPETKTNDTPDVMKMNLDYINSISSLAGIREKIMVEKVEKEKENEKKLEAANAKLMDKLLKEPIVPKEEMIVEPAVNMNLPAAEPSKAAPTESVNDQKQTLQGPEQDLLIKTEIAAENLTKIMPADPSSNVYTPGLKPIINAPPAQPVKKEKKKMSLADYMKMRGK